MPDFKSNIRLGKGVKILDADNNDLTQAMIAAMNNNKGNHRADPRHIALVNLRSWHHLSITARSFIDKWILFTAIMGIVLLFTILDVSPHLTSGAIFSVWLAAVTSFALAVVITLLCSYMDTILSSLMMKMCEGTFIPSGDKIKSINRWLFITTMMNRTSGALAVHGLILIIVLKVLHTGFVG